MLVHIVEMHKRSTKEKHSYIVGAFTSMKKAELIAAAETKYSGNRYSSRIVSVNLNESTDESLYAYHHEIPKQD